MKSFVLLQLAFLSELHSDKMMALPAPMMQGVYQSVQIGLQNCATDSFTFCCEFLSVVYIIYTN